MRIQQRMLEADQEQAMREAHTEALVMRQQVMIQQEEQVKAIEDRRLVSDQAYQYFIPYNRAFDKRVQILFSLNIYCLFYMGTPSWKEGNVLSENVA